MLVQHCSIKFITNYKMKNKTLLFSLILFSFAVTNILNDIPVQVYRGFNAEDKIFSQRQLQRTFKVGYSLKIK